MDCKRVDQELVGFHLAAIDGATRAAVEAHLCGCARCVGAYLMLKRAVDGEEEAMAPSELVRARIRGTARTELGATKGRRWLWAAAAAGVAASLAVAVMLVVQRPAPTPTPTPPSQTVPYRGMVPVENVVDTARATPENLSYL